MGLNWLKEIRVWEDRRSQTKVVGTLELDMMYPPFPKQSWKMWRLFCN